jgi:uncharacterized RDD family membrane protein YckC
VSNGVAAGWYPDPADPDTQRYWDGEQWVGEHLPVGDVPPSGPLSAPAATPAPVSPVEPSSPGGHQTPLQQAPAGQYAPGHPRHAAGHGPPAPQVPQAPAASAEPLPGVLAPLLDRLAARLIDIVAVFLLNVVVNGYFVYQYVQEVLPAFRAAQRAGNAITPSMLSDRANTLGLIIPLVAAALWFAYEVPYIATTGQTPGKRLVGVQVTTLTGEPVGFGRSIQRWALPGLPLLVGGWLLPLQLLDSAWCLWDKRRQCLHDKSARTVVVTAPPAAPSTPPTA